jgi:hypothetical protein
MPVKERLGGGGVNGRFAFAGEVGKRGRKCLTLGLMVMIMILLVFEDWVH